MSNLYESKRLREERADIIKQMQSLVVAAKKENRALNGEDQAKFDKMDGAAATLLEQAEGHERMERFDALTSAETRSGRTEVLKTVSIDPDKDFDLALRGWLCQTQPGTFPRDERWDTSAERLGLDLRGKSFSLEYRTPSLSGGTATAGKELVPTTLSRSVVEALKAYGGVLSVCNLIPTTDFAPFDVPTIDDTDKLADKQTDNVATTDDGTDQPVFAKKTLGGWEYATKIIRVPYTLIRNSAIPIVPLLTGLLTTRVKRKLGPVLTSGVGTTEPQGVLTGAGNSGVVAAATTAVTYTEVMNLIYSVDPEYRNNPSSCLMAGDGGIKALRLMLDGFERPLWQPSLIAGQPDTFAGVRVVANYDMEFGASKKAFLYGDFDQYWVRQCGGFDLLQSDDRYFEFRQAAFAVLTYIDAVVMNSGAIKYLTMHAAGSG